MKLIVGLGNPGKEYEHTRHNVGFDIIDLLCKKYNIEANRKKFKGLYGEGIIEGERALILKPTTYMNLSGESIKEVLTFYKVPNENIIVIYDDISLEVGRLRVRDKGSAGGHNGIKSIISHLGSDVFPRIKIGVGQPSKDNLVSHVLGKFSKDESQKLNETFNAAVEAIEVIIQNGTSEAMNKFNGFKVD
jgi:PTH1 family peptidyl-tRNA hydrolase